MNQINVEGLSFDSGLRTHNVNVYNMENALIASGYPMRKGGFDRTETNENDYKRAGNLSKAPAGSGHDNFLKGIQVCFSLRANQAFWLQFERYTFQDTVSSQSTMHKIATMTREELTQVCSDYVYPELLDRLYRDILEYREIQNDLKANGEKRVIYSTVDVSSQDKCRLSELEEEHAELKGLEKIMFETIVANIPEGIMLTRHITTNYLQLKTMYAQRKHHKTQQWKDFCKFVEQLPQAKEMNII